MAALAQDSPLALRPSGHLNRTLSELETAELPLVARRFHAPEPLLFSHLFISPLIITS